MLFKLKNFSVLALAVAAGLGTASVRADSVPVGVNWSCGEYTGLPSSYSFDQFNGPVAVPGFPGLEEWVGTTPPTSPVTTDPNVIYNATGSDILTDPIDGNIDFAANSINLGPWHGPTVVRYTASTSGLYDVEADFETAQLGNTSPSAFVYLGGSQTANWSSGQLADPAGNSRFGVASSYSDVVTLSAGEAIDFVVYGQDTANKTTQLSAAVTLLPSADTASAVPLPKSAGVGFSMLGVFGSLAALRRKLVSRSRIA